MTKKSIIPKKCTTVKIAVQIEISKDVLQVAERIAGQRGLSLNEFLTELIDTEAIRFKKHLERQYGEAEVERGTQEVIADLRALDDEGWPDE